MSAALLLAICFACPQAAAERDIQLRERWETPYTASDATGSHVIGLWSFDSKDPGLDASGHGRTGKLDGAKTDARGRFGTSLRIFRGWPVEDRRHRMIVADDPSLSPQGPFTIELWINADETLEDYPQAFLVDKKYVSDNDYQLILQGPDSNGLRTLQVNLGFGSRSASWHSNPLKVLPGTWYHVAFSYDSAGTGRIFLNGQLWGAQQVDGVQQISGGTHPLSIGDRVGSYYHGFPGRIDQVRITKGAREFRPLRLERVTDRTCYRRMEEDIAIRFRLVNLDHRTIRDAELTWKFGNRDSVPIPVPQLQSGEVSQLTYDIDTSLRPDTYQLQATLSWGKNTRSIARDSFAVQIAPRSIPQQFPVVMWGAGPSELQRLKRIGFTHALGISADYGRIWNAGKPVAPAEPDKVQALRRELDRALANEMSFAASLSPAKYLRDKEELLRVDRSLNPNSSRKDICGLFPQMGPFFRNVGESVAQAYGDMPAFGAALLNTEVRDAANICFHTHDREACRAATGADIPALAKTKWGVKYQQLDGFPANRVIPDDHPLYRFYCWYWKQGDGWNALNSQLRSGLQTMGRPDFWTWHDPAVRVASVLGSGGDVDVLSQWTYSYPDPIRIGVATDELLAMTRGSKRQQVMKMTQIIWYRSQTAPQPKTDDDKLDFEARWEREQPGAPFITIAPMHLREAFWTKIARPIKGIMYHGWQSLVPVEGSSGYRHTHSETQNELRRLIETVVQPLGPALRLIPAAQADVAYYESFAAQMFAGRGTYGWGGKWQGDGHLIAQWAGLQPEVLFDETIREQGLDPYKILFMMNCDVVTESVAKEIQQFQSNGGIVIGDENTVPAVKPDIVLPIYQRTGNAARDKTALLDIASQLRNELTGRYARYVDSDNLEVIPYRRRFADTDYLFLINDHRQYGLYVGHHRRVMENGLPSEATITVSRSRAFVYDLVRHEAVSCRSLEGHLAIKQVLGPCEGRMLMITSQEIGGVQLEAPSHVKPGQQARIQMKITTTDGVPIRAVVPIELTIEDSEARRAEFSGSWAAVDGVLSVVLDIAPNDPRGAWTIRAKELASGRSATAHMMVQGSPVARSTKTMDKNAANPVQPDG